MKLISYETINSKAGYTLVVFLCAVFIVGLLLVLRASTMPAFTDEAAHSELMIENPPDTESRSLSEFTSAWFRRLQSLTTNKWFYHDLGTWLISFVITISVFSCYVKFWRGQTFVTLETPRSRIVLLLLGTLSLALFFVGTLWADFDDVARGLVPPFADSLGIPIMRAQAGFIDAALVCKVLGFFILLPARLPANLWVWDSAKQMKSWLVSIPFGLLVFLFLCLTVFGYQIGPIVQPLSAFLAIYVALSARAGLLSPRKTIDLNGSQLS